MRQRAAKGHSNACKPPFYLMPGKHLAFRGAAKVCALNGRRETMCKLQEMKPGFDRMHVRLV
jgi:hypothetical protein